MIIEQLLQMATALGMGLYIATSPCIFPLLPLFLIRSLQSEGSRKKSLLITLVLCFGILLSLAIFIAIASVIGLLIMRYYDVIQGVLVLIVIFLGILTMSQKLRNKLGVSRLKMRDPGEPRGLLSVFVMGFGYSLIAAPCTGPVILSIPFVFGAVIEPILLLLMFLVLCIGVIIPYLIVALLTGEARQRMISTMSASAHKLEIIVGILLVVVGIILTWPWLSGILTT